MSFWENPPTLHMYYILESDLIYKDLVHNHAEQEVCPIT